VRFISKLLLAVGIFSAGTATALAAETRVVPANQASAIMFYYAASSDTCHSAGRPKVHISGKPKHGSVTSAWRAFRMGKDAGKCAGMPMHGTVVVYKPVPGYRGTDKVSVIFRDGASTGYFVREKEWTINITVK
jgi:hypothetical protein